MNKLYYGDNLDVMRKFIRDETVDLCYIDPPFNSRAQATTLVEPQFADSAPIFSAPTKLGFTIVSFRPNLI